MSKSQRIMFPPLTKNEWNEVKKIWGGVKMDSSTLKIFPKGYQIYKGLEGFDPQYCPSTIFEPYILRGLNLPVHVMGMEHKAILDMIFPGIKQPITVIKRINGTFFDKERNILDIQAAYKYVSSQDALCIKPTAFSAGGNSVKKIVGSALDFRQFEEIVLEYGENFIVQEILHQSPKMSRLSATSLNTFRVSSLFINGKCSICTIICRIGRGDSFVDNGAKGNYIVGVDFDGQFREYAYDFAYDRFSQTDTGIKFGDIKINEIAELVKLVETFHPKYIPNCGFCGWDFALDENNSWNLIEVNLYAPGIEFEQICPGKSLFGERTGEVIEYVNHHQPSLLAIMTSLGYA